MQTAQTLTSTKPTKSRYDAIVVGGGHNGLVCAAYLAKAGHDVWCLAGGGSAGR